MSLLNKLRLMMNPDSKQTVSPEKSHPLAVTNIPVNELSINKVRANVLSNLKSKFLRIEFLIALIRDYFDY